jgi:threonyl-tRNA synthetase
VDFHLPSRFDLSFQRGPVREQPVMVHRSIVSTVERMIAHLLEVHDGALPVWLAPTQAVILPVSDEALSYAAHLHDSLRRSGLRADLDDRNATLAARVRDAQQRHIPYVAVVGAREAAAGTVSVRLRNSRQNSAMSTGQFASLAQTVATKRLPGLLPEPETA